MGQVKELGEEGGGREGTWEMKGRHQAVLHLGERRPLAKNNDTPESPRKKLPEGRRKRERESKKALTFPRPSSGDCPRSTTEKMGVPA
jgi:hypothetical protein